MSNTEEETTTCEGEEQDIDSGEMETDITNEEELDGEMEADVTNDAVEVKSDTTVESTSDAVDKSKETSVPEHPYKKELSEFKPHEWQLEAKEPVMYTSLEDTKFTLVDSLSLLEEMMVKLKEAKELAIDLEHHSYRSFNGMVCLVKISTRTEDFVIDSLLLKNELKLLNDVYTDSNILKVSHGTNERHFEWLQKDFGVYVINLFDTQKAAKALNEESLSMTSLLKKHCQVEVKKEFPRKDRRLRPLPDDMIKCAREDVHYLLYIHDVYRNALLKLGKDSTKVLEDVYAECTTACGVMWYPEKRAFHSKSYLGCYSGIKMKTKLNPQQLECFRLLFEWRHKISLEKDESTGYTLPNKMMVKIAKLLPTDSKGIVSCCGPTVRPSVQENLEGILELIAQAIKKVPHVPAVEVSDLKKNTSKGKGSRGKNFRGKNFRGKTFQARPQARHFPCQACGRIGHNATECDKPASVARGGMKQMRGGGRGWNRGPAPLFGSYPGGPGMRGGAGFRNHPARGPRPLAAMRMHPYSAPHHGPRSNMYHGMDDYNNGGVPYDPSYQQYGQPGPRPFNVGHPRGMNYF